MIMITSRSVVIVLGFAAAAAAACALGGCARPSRDVTSDSRYHGGYIPQQVYVLARETAAIGKPGEPVFLYPPEQLPPPSEYRAGQYTRIPPGTRLRASKFVFEDKQIMPTYWEYVLRVYGEMLDGPLAGRVAELHGLSERGSWGFDPNPAYLRPQERGGKTP
jgi:hypothetical protein